MKRTCNTCGHTQGPFARLFVGDRKTGKYIFTCPIPVKDKEGKPVADAKRKEIAMACNNRRDKRNGTAQTHHTAGS